MKIVNRHLSGDFARLFLASSTVFVSVFLVVTFFEKLKTLLKYKASAGDAFLFLAAKIPWIICQTAPLSVLLATLLSVTLLSRHGEITAFRCGGISLRRLALPYVAAGLVVSLASLAFQEFVVPRAAAFSREVEEIRIRGRSQRSLVRARDLWLRLGDRILHVAKVLPAEKRLLAVALIELADGRVARRVDAKEAQWTGDRWILTDAEIRTFRPEGGIETQRFAETTYPLSEGPSDFNIARSEPEEMTLSSLRSQIKRFRAQGLDARDLEAGLWGKTSLPFASAVMPLLGFPFALRRGRQGGTSVGIALGIGIGFAYWLTLAVGLSLGKAGTLPTPLGAWAGNLLFTAVGLVLLLRAERV